VAIIEASACEKPVVVSNEGGLPEVVKDGETGFVVPPKDPRATAMAIEKLMLDKELCIKMGKKGRKRVMKLYNWDDNVDLMISIYQGLIV
jgi:glycosyltransferase involved in cell wall biosynthesis